MTTYLPACPACREHSPTTFHTGCQGCIERSRIAAQHTTLTDDQVGYADSMFQTLPEANHADQA